MPTIKKHLKSLLGEFEFNKIFELGVSQKLDKEEINKKISIQSNFNDLKEKKFYRVLIVN